MLPQVHPEVGYLLMVTIELTYLQSTNYAIINCYKTRGSFMLNINS